MKWLDRIAHAFIMTFGITQPTAANKRAANLFIGVLLLSIVVGLLAIIVFGVTHLTK